MKYEQKLLEKILVLHKNKQNSSQEMLTYENKKRNPIIYVIFLIMESFAPLLAGTEARCYK